MRLSLPMETADTSVRELNMAKRRQKILHEAGKMLASGGVEKLNLRKLACASDVTVPTIYNLIGNKEAIIVALFSDALSEIERRLNTHQDETPFAMATALVVESVGLFAEDESYYRAAFIAVEYLDHSTSHHQSVAGIYQWAESLIAAGIGACRQAKLIRGCIDTAVLSSQMLSSYRTSCRAWASQKITIDEFRCAGLIDIYLCLAADAVETFRTQLINEISQLSHAPNNNLTKHNAL